MASLSVPSFQISLGHPILDGQITIGKYDGLSPSFTCATTGGKILVHSPHNRAAVGTSNPATSPTEIESDIRFLNVNKQITALVAGCLNPTIKRDTLVIGSQTSLKGFDVEENSDTFTKDIPDGVNRILLGPFGASETPMAIVGGRCSIQGFDQAGKECYFNVTGGSVSAMCFCPWEPGHTDMLVGSDDSEIRAFRNEEVLASTTETDKVTLLEPLGGGGQFAYALANGILGSYTRAIRQWRVKSAAPATVAPRPDLLSSPRVPGRVDRQHLAMVAFDIDGDGAKELITSLPDGALEVRRGDTGDALARETFPAAITALATADYRMDGQTELLCCSADGEIRAYLPLRPSESAPAAAAMASTGPALPAAGSPGVLSAVAKAAPEEGLGALGQGTSVDGLLAQLTQQRQELALEVATLEENLTQQKQRAHQAGLIPTSTEIQVELQADRARGVLELVCRTTADTIIRGVAIFAEQLFDGEALFCPNPTLSPEMRVPICPKKCIDTEMQVRVMVGVRGGTAFHVFEVKQRLPKFALHCRVPMSTSLPASSCTFRITERIQRVVLWVQQCFPMAYTPENPDRIDLLFSALGKGDPLGLVVAPAEGGSYQVTIRTDDMELAGDLVQDLCQFLQRAELDSLADFPTEMERFQKVLQKVLEFNALRLKLTADMADGSNLVKALVVKAEDARLLGNMPLLRSALNELKAANEELLQSYRIRATNHQELLTCLKDVNQMIQKAARLRWARQ
ncbi:putative Bardet-Biedl syndrome 2 protein [Paratrimastix pyriformis]|uniref:Bardet-Biedl syndrome 2 protein n=1 Tax=Paratrimastix pyriformis TaxID=342808 RepID=A0ABQ8UN31_9EUKA|nr:putative Bardet-Biedl syndrome 2 protein [Paratrimastix pyriformis]